MAKAESMKAEARRDGETIAQEKREAMTPYMEKKGGSVRRPRRASGGKLNVYNAAGSPAVEAAMDESEDEFKKGGHAKRQAGGMVMGEAAKMRGDKMPRGRHERHAAGGRAGGSPFSSGSKVNAPKDDAAGRGREGIKVPSEPD